MAGKARPEADRQGKARRATAGMALGALALFWGGVAVGVWASGDRDPTGPHGAPLPGLEAHAPTIVATEPRSTESDSKPSEFPATQESGGTLRADSGATGAAERAEAHATEPLDRRVDCARRRLFGSGRDFLTAEADLREELLATVDHAPKPGEDPLVAIGRVQRAIAGLPELSREAQARRLEAFLLAECGGDRDTLAELLHRIRVQALEEFSSRYGGRIPDPGMVGNGLPARIFDLLCR